MLSMRLWHTRCDRTVRVVMGFVRSKAALLLCGVMANKKDRCTGAVNAIGLCEW